MGRFGLIGNHEGVLTSFEKKTRKKKRTVWTLSCDTGEVSNVTFIPIIKEICFNPSAAMYVSWKKNHFVYSRS